MAPHTKCLKKRSEKLFPFSITVENILQTIFSGGNTDSRYDDIPPARSPTQVVISAFRMVIWVIS
jgi:hypothetical protein